MRVLHLLKTSDGARWAVDQARVLCRLGVEVHVALPDDQGCQWKNWQRSEVHLHIENLGLPVTGPWHLPARLGQLRTLLSRVKPDLIHSHFVSNTLLLRLALGKSHPTPRIFQVPGPLHLEHSLYRNAELALAGNRDYWIASSRCIRDLYLQSGISDNRLFLSYYGNQWDKKGSGIGLRMRLGISPERFLVGNVNLFYPPKRYLGQNKGLKGHETVIRALGMAMERDDRIEAVLVGGDFYGKSPSYERKLRKMAEEHGRGRIHMTGRLGFEEARKCWEEIDCAIHVPLSENCGGVLEPLMAGVPTIAAEVGGLPELVMEGWTGRLVPPGNVKQIARALLDLVSEPGRDREMALRGQKLVSRMFDAERTAAEVYEIYRHILDPGVKAPGRFDSLHFASDGAHSYEGPERGGALCTR